MERPDKELLEEGHIFEYYIERLEEYCDFLEASLKTSKTRTDYWCTQCTEARMQIKLLKQDLERRKRETTI